MTNKTMFKLSDDAIESLGDISDVRKRFVLVPVQGKPLTFDLRDFETYDSTDALIDAVVFKYSDRRVVKLYDAKGRIIHTAYFYND